jgi:hypothetical protein
MKYAFPSGCLIYSDRASITVDDDSITVRAAKES